MKNTVKTTYWKIFRLTFVLFSGVLMGDAFYRWDGFRYYAPFSEFLPSLALVSIFWSLLAAVAALLVWLFIKILERGCSVTGSAVDPEILVLFIAVSGFTGIFAWVGKRLIYTGGLSLQVKLIVLFLVVFFAVLFTRSFHDRFPRWMKAIQERITPLVFLFGICVFIAVPLVIYHTWVKDAGLSSSGESFHSSNTDDSRPNIILVTFDALSARDMSLYGFERDTTPFISKWAGKASLFTRLKAASNFTGPTVASLMTGKRLWTHQKYDPHEYGSKPVRSDTESLPLVLKDSGYFTMAFVQNRHASPESLGIENGFVVMPQTIDFVVRGTSMGIINSWLERIFSSRIRMANWIMLPDFIFGMLLNKVSGDMLETEYPADKVFNIFLGTGDGDLPEPFFAWIHILPPHNNYLPTREFMGMFDPSDEFRTYASQDEFFMRGENADQAAIDTLRARYDEFIRYCDEKFREFIMELEKRGMTKNSVIILSSDHGEIFEHGHLTHGTSLYEPETSIPLVIKEPGQAEGQIINDLVEQIDITATILDIAGISSPGWVEGQSLIPLLRGENQKQRHAFSMNFETNRSMGHEITKGMIAVWEGDYKLVHTLQENKSILFDLSLDRNEQNDLIEKRPEIREYLLNLIFENLEDANEKIRNGG